MTPTQPAEGLPEPEITQADRELLAAEYESSGFGGAASDIRNGIELGGIPGVAIRAIAAARRQAQGGGSVAYWAAVAEGVIELGLSADDANGGEATRAEVNYWINERPRPGDFRLVGLYTAPQEGTCHWHQTEDGFSDGFNTSCGHEYIVNDGETGGMRFCTFCGKRAVFHPWSSDEDTAAQQEEAP